MDSPDTKNWSLCKYSQFKPHKNIQVPGENTAPGCNGEWVTQEDSTMMLSLTHEGHLLIQRNDVILENIFLPFGATATTSLKVLKNNDVLVFMHSHLGEARIFRVQFEQVGSTPNQAIDDCAENLAKYFAVRSTNSKENAKKKASKTSTGVREGEEDNDHIAHTVMVSKIIEDKLEDLPLLYRDQTIHARLRCETEQGPDMSMEHFVSLCLADPTFPSYVSQVEKIIKKFSNKEKSD